MANAQPGPYSYHCIILTAVCSVGSIGSNHFCLLLFFVFMLLIIRGNC